MKKLGFGTLRLPLTNPDDVTSIDQVLLNHLVDEFMKSGYSYFETGYAYHSMQAEDAIRQALVERYPRDSYCFADKMPTYNLQRTEDFENIFAEQLRRCGLSYFDYYLLHNLGKGRLIQCEKLGGFEFLRKKKKEGVVKNIGFSFHDTPELLEELLIKYPETDVVQLQINYIDWENISVQSRRCYEVARKYHKPIIVMEPVKGGVLSKIPEEAEKLMREVHPDKSPAFWALRFAAGLDGVFMVLSGMNTLEQIKDNVRTFNNLTLLTQKEQDILEKVTQIINQKSLISCTACRYCIDICPEHIQIPNLLSIFNETLMYGDLTMPRVHYQHAIFGHGKAVDCIACGECEKICPEHLPVSKLMLDIAGRFS